MLVVVFVFYLFSSYVVLVGIVRVFSCSCCYAADIQLGSALLCVMYTYVNSWIWYEMIMIEVYHMRANIDFYHLIFIL